MPDQAPSQQQNTAEELVKRNAACIETRTARNTWYVLYIYIIIIVK
jgi:hypothetical protein